MDLPENTRYLPEPPETRWDQAGRPYGVEHHGDTIVSVYPIEYRTNRIVQRVLVSRAGNTQTLWLPDQIERLRGLLSPVPEA